MQMPDDICKKVREKFGKLPYKERGIEINEALIIATIEILYASKGKILPLCIKPYFLIFRRLRKTTYLTLFSNYIMVNLWIIL